MPKVTNKDVEDFSTFLEKRGTHFIPYKMTGREAGHGEFVAIRDLLEEWEEFKDEG